MNVIIVKNYVIEMIFYCNIFNSIEKFCNRIVTNNANICSHVSKL